MKKFMIACSLGLVSISCGSQNERAAVNVYPQQAEEGQLAVTSSPGAVLTVSTCRANVNSPELCTSTVRWANAPAGSCVFIKGTGQTFACGGASGSAQAPWLRTATPGSLVFLLADRKNPAVVYRESQAPTPELTVSTCRANANSPELCTSTVRWANVPADSCVFIKGTGQTFACGGTSGSAQAPWLRTASPGSIVFLLADRRNPVAVYREAQARTSAKTGPDANGKYNLKVDGGYGSGTFAAGETVYVWSSVSTTNGVALPWSGDASLLKSPAEWISTFVMPSRNVSLTANSAVQNLELKVETFKGSTTVGKTMRYYFPPAMKGLVFMSHGTGGNSSYIENTETFTIALALVKRGFGVLSTEAEEAVAGDLNGDGRQRWQTVFTSSNTDLKNLSTLLSGLEQRGLITASTPKFAMGMSNGGAFSHFLGAVGNSSVANTFPKIRFKSVVGYCSDASQIYRNSSSRTPSAWYMCGAEDNPEVSLTEARENERRLKAAGVPTEYYENPPSPLYDGRFTRVAGITLEASKAIANELRAAGYVDAKGFLNKDADEIVLEITEPQNASSFPTLLTLPEGSQNRIKNQLKVMRAEHAQYGDQVERNIRFFEKFL